MIIAKNWAQLLAYLLQKLPWTECEVFVINIEML